MVMKKILFGMLMILACSVGVAQTNFRHLTYGQALAAAKAEKKLVFVDFYTVWCGPCKAMLRDVFPQKAVGDYLNERFVCIKLDAEKEGKELADRLKVNAYPTFIGFDVTGKEVMRKVGGGDAKSFLADLERQINPEKSPERLVERYNGGERTAELIEAYAALKMNEAEGEMMNNMSNYWVKVKEVYALVKEYLMSLKDEERLSAKNLFVYMQYTSSPLDEVAQYMVAHRDQFDPAIKQQITDRIAMLHKSYMRDCFSRGKNFDKEGYGRVKRSILDLGLNEDGGYDSVFCFIECYAEGDLNAYLTLCEEEYKSLEPSFQTDLLVKIPSLIDMNDQDLLKRTSKFIRSHLAELDPSKLYTVVIVLSQVERNMKPVNG